MVIIQKGKAPSLHLVTIAILTLRQTLRTHTSLIDYNKDHEISSSAENVSETEEEYVEEHEGMHFFRLRLYQLLHSIFTLKPIHLAATLLHPRYRLLKKCSLNEVRKCHLYIRNRMAHIKDIEKNKFKSAFSQEQSSMVDNKELDEPDETDDELNKYLEQHIAIELIDDNPLRFWCEHRFIYPTLSRLARSIFSIPATTANVERQFSGSGLMINSRRTRLDPEQVNDALFLRSIFELYRRIAKYFNNIVVYRFFFCNVVEMLNATAKILYVF
ncbi:unnamed protein product [Rotaria sp. Silwood2]|nr:unnamed protein product [Rotaria sp. Silwood2]